MKVLVVGSGGREHALAWKLAQSDSVSKIYATPGNPGIAEVAECISLPTSSPQAILDLAQHLLVDLTVVGPEALLVAGIVDQFQAAGQRIIGPTQANARLEGSKIFAKAFFSKHGIPTARFDVVAGIGGARFILERSRYPIVLKTDGLAAGKGVVIAHNRDEAEQALELLGPRIVIEEFLSGEEVSFIVLSDGREVVPLEPCQDHKTAFDNDSGPNTGGMGAYCDSRILSEPQREEILDRIIRPTIAATGFSGFLYAGVMLTDDGPKLLEFNVRLGDPETQPMMHRLSSDLGSLLMDASEGRLAHAKPDWRPQPSICVVLASAGYPGPVKDGFPITGIEAAEKSGATVFQAGTIDDGLDLQTAGGRVLGVTARGDNLPEAIANVYQSVSQINFAGMHFRRDIGRKGLQRYNM